MSLSLILAHSSGLGEAWGFAYTGTVVGGLVGGVAFVRARLAGVTRSRHGGGWWIVAGLVLGCCLGLGIGRLLEDLGGEEASPATTAVVATTSAQRNPTTGWGV